MRKILLEMQAGFRKNRSTTDNVYISQQVIEREIAKNRGKVFTFFVEIKLTFDSFSRQYCGGQWKVEWSTKDSQKNNENMPRD